MAQPLVEAVSGIVHEPTQTEGSGVDLTLAAVHRVSAPGRVDFGGGELETAALDPVATQLREPEDDYEWWDLDAGQYLLSYNEALDVAEDRRLVLQTRDEVLARGAFHPTLRVSALDPVPFVVGGEGIRLKENARVSTLLDSG